MKKLEKERKTIGIMIRIFCGAHHGITAGDLCSECEELFGYAGERLRRCPFGENKGPCSKCRIHCYKPDMRKRITEVMRYSGPRMIKRHPLLAIDHLLKARGSGDRRGAAGGGRGETHGQ
ncbi:MAG: nitrous oxide-stimulated promoter family protein [Planctomycetota bacterium]